MLKRQVSEATASVVDVNQNISIIGKDFYFKQSFKDYKLFARGKSLWKALKARFSIKGVKANSDYKVISFEDTMEERNRFYLKENWKLSGKVFLFELL